MKKRNLDFFKIVGCLCCSVSLVAFLFGCEKTEDIEFSSDQLKTDGVIKATSCTNDVLRSGVVYGNGNIAEGENFIWHEGDGLLLFFVDGENHLLNGEKAEEFHIANYWDENPASSADFLGKVPTEMCIRKILALSNQPSNMIKVQGQGLSYNLYHRDAVQIGKTTEQLSDMDFMYGFSDVEKSIAEGSAVILPNIEMKHISSLLRYHVVNSTDANISVMRISVSAENAEPVFYKSALATFDLNDRICAVEGTSTMSSVNIDLQSSVSDGSVNLAQNEEYDAYQMILPTSNLSDVKLNIEVLLSSDNGKTIYRCKPLADLSIKNGAFKSGYRYAFKLNITESMLVKENSLLMEGEGTELSPYLITNVKSLNNFRDLVNMGIKPYTTAYYKQTENIDLQGVDWKPMGTKDHPFLGVYNGNGWNIKNLKLKGDVCGLFAYVGSDKNHDARIINVNLVSLTNEGPSVCVGAVTAYLQGTISDCNVSGMLNSSAYASVGGLVGTLGEGGSVFKSSSTIDISGIGEMGALLGVNDGGYVYTSASHGSVTLSESGYAGGLVGNNKNGAIVGCYSTIQIGRKSGSGACGGLVGYNDATLACCFTTGNVEGLNNVGSVVGKNTLTGLVRSVSSTQNFTTIGNDKGTAISVGMGLDVTEILDGIKEDSFTIPGSIVSGGVLLIEGKAYSLGQTDGLSIWSWRDNNPILYWEEE